MRIGLSGPGFRGESPWPRSADIRSNSNARQEYQAGETLHGLATRHGISRNLVRVWAAKAEAGEFDDDLAAASILQKYEARIGAPEGLCGTLASRQAGLHPSLQARGLSVAQGCRLMSLARSTYSDEPARPPIEEARLIERIKEICANGAILDAWSRHVVDYAIG